MRLGRHALAALMALGSIEAVLGAGPSATDPRFDPAFQERIEQTVVAVVRQDDSAQGRIESLGELAKGRRETLLLQLALYLSNSASTEQSMAGALIVRHLEFTPDEKLDAVLPHLETVEPRLRRVLTELLATIDRTDSGVPDFSIYEARINKERHSPAPALVGYLYEVSPEAAVKTMARIYGGRDASLNLQDLLARRDVPRARAELERLSRDPAWWVRLYVAGILNANPDLAAPAVTIRLRNDPDPLVRKAAPR